MTNVITTEEMLEQYGGIPLEFSFYSNKQFVFRGTSMDVIDITLILSAEIVYELHANRRQTINGFAAMLKDERLAKLIKVRINHNFANVYQN